MFLKILLTRGVSFSVSVVRKKSYVSFEKPSLVGSVLRNRFLQRTQIALLSSDDNIAKKFLVDEGSIAVLSTAEKLARNLLKHDIKYAIVGGFALNVHGFKRQTIDVDVLMSKDDLVKFKQKIQHNGFAPRFRGAEKSFRDPTSNVGVDIIVSGTFPGDGKPKSLAFPEVTSENVMEIDGLTVIDLKTLIDLKLTSYQNLPMSRMKDRTDVSGLVKFNTLDETFAERLHESVRDEYLTIVKEVVEEEQNCE